MIVLRLLVTVLPWARLLFSEKRPLRATCTAPGTKEDFNEPRSPAKWLRAESPDRLSLERRGVVWIRGPA